MKSISILKNSGAIALLPFAVFIVSFLGTGLALDDFYAFKAPVAAVLGILAAFLLLKGSVDAKVKTFLAGCGDEKILTMCLIYLLAGAFATVTGAMGGVAATVQLGLSIIPPQYLALGTFLLAAFISTATGTSVGAIVALGPVVVGLAAQSGLPLPLLLGSLLGGAMFGDNLSLISDTTIAATQTQECQMKDKFKVNLFIAGPAALLTVVLLLYAGSELPAAAASTATFDGFSFWQIFPYLLVIGLAVAGLHVFSVLVLSTLVAGIIGLALDKFELLAYTQLVYEGFTGMTEIFLLSLLTGGLGALVTAAGGIELLLRKIRKAVHSYSSAQAGIAALVGITNAALANNTVSIVLTGDLARNIAQQYGVERRKSAALLDISACIVQGLLPYGAQMLLLLSFAEGALSFTDVLANAWYLYLLAGFSVVAIITPWLDRYLFPKQQRPKLPQEKVAA